MKANQLIKVVIILSVMLLIAGCGDGVLSKTEWMEKLEGNTDKDISLVINQFDEKNCTAEISVINNTSHEVVFGEDYYIQQKSGNAWKEVKHKTAIDGWNAVAFSVEAKGDFSWTIHWEVIYGVLGKGEYRIVKPFLANNSKNYRDNGYCVCEFSIGNID